MKSKLDLGRRLVLTCEHAGNRIPTAWKAHFAKQGYKLQTHHGWDPGAMELAKRLASDLKAPLHLTEWSRLLCDCNRDEDHPEVISEMIQHLSAAQKQSILQNYHRPFRHKVAQQITDCIQSNRSGVFHLSLHSFTPRFRGQLRNCELGVMFDSRVAAEKKLAGRLARHLACMDRHFRVRMNYPYVGRDTYFQPALRKQFCQPEYLGLQLEVNQKLPLRQKARWQRLQRALVEFFAQPLKG
jgi:predicted N-formylglutamate amidohydrolase